MKPKILAVALFVATAGAVGLYPFFESAVAVTPPPQAAQLPAHGAAVTDRPKIEVVFVLDTTGSMSGLIEAAKEKIWSIATTMAQARPAPEIRMGLVAYRDRGDDYVTRVVDLSTDLDSVYATLMDFRADGGGDGPESVNQALDDALNRISWSADQSAYQVVFLVGDAPPHMDYQDDVKYPQTIKAATGRGIVVNAVQCGSDPVTARRWQEMARLGDGTVLEVEQDGSAVAIATPFDKDLADLSAQLDETRLYYGSAEEKAVKQRKVEAAEKLHAGASVAARARRATFNASKSGEANLTGEGELVEDVASGKVDLDTIDREALPTPMQALAPEAQKALVEETAARRTELKRQIETLAEQRSAYLKEKVAEQGGAAGSLDDELYDAVREQAGKKGIRYEAAAPAY